MSDLVAGRYALAEEEWMLDGQPLPPYRRSISRRDITVSTISIASTTLTVYPIVCQPGDLIGAVSLLVKTATATPTHSWVALYTGLTTASTLITQSADAVGGFTANALKLALGTTYQVGGGPGGVAQGGPATTASGATVLGLAIYCSGGATVFDGMAGSAVAGAVALTGQVPLAFTVTVAATATAPATLAGAVAAIQGVPYIVLSRS